jgi:hypothetical protein
MPYIRGCKIPIGSQIGWGTLVKFTPGVTGYQGCRASYKLRCSTCGALHTGQSELLTRARMQHKLGKTCPSCTSQVKRTSRICPVCSDPPSRRPRSGCRVCGGQWMPDVIVGNADDRHGWEAWGW